MSKRLILWTSPVCPLCPPLLVQARALRLPVAVKFVAGSSASRAEGLYHAVMRMVNPERLPDFMIMRWTDMRSPRDALLAMGVTEHEIARHLLDAYQTVLAETAEWDLTHERDALPALQAGRWWFYGPQAIEEYHDTCQTVV